MSTVEIFVAVAGIIICIFLAVVSVRDKDIFPFGPP